jgi:hypothetical protein
MLTFLKTFLYFKRTFYLLVRYYVINVPLNRRFLNSDHLIVIHIFKDENKINLQNIKTSCQYYKPMTVVNDDSRVVTKLETSLTDEARVVIYDRYMSIIQATDNFKKSSFVISY